MPPAVSRRSPSPTSRCRCPAASACGRPSSRRACCSRSSSAAANRCSRSVRAAATSPRCSRAARRDVTTVEIDPALSASARGQARAARLRQRAPRGRRRRARVGATSSTTPSCSPGRRRCCPRRFLAQLKPNGRVFAIVGEAPAMTARLVAWTAPGSRVTTDLFETVVAPLEERRDAVALQVLIPRDRAGRARRLARGRRAAGAVASSTCASRGSTTIARIEGSLLDPAARDCPRAWRELPGDRELVLVCHHGAAAQQAAQWLARNGFARVHNLARRHRRVGAPRSIPPCHGTEQRPLLTVRVMPTTSMKTMRSALPCLALRSRASPRRAARRGSAAGLPRGAEAGSGDRRRALAVGGHAGARAAGARRAAAAGVARRARPTSTTTTRSSTRIPRSNVSQNYGFGQPHVLRVAAAVPAAERRGARPGARAGRRSRTSRSASRSRTSSSARRSPTSTCCSPSSTSSWPSSRRSRCPSSSRRPSATSRSARRRSPTPTKRRRSTTRSSPPRSRRATTSIAGAPRSRRSSASTPQSLKRIGTRLRPAAARAQQRRLLGRRARCKREPARCASRSRTTRSPRSRSTARAPATCPRSTSWRARARRPAAARPRGDFGGNSRSALFGVVAQRADLHRRLRQFARARDDLAAGPGARRPRVGQAARRRPTRRTASPASTARRRA